MPDDRSVPVTRTASGSSNPDPTRRSPAADLEPTAEEIEAARRAREAREARARSGERDGDEPGSRRPSALRNAIEWVAVVGIALVFALLIRMFLFQTFWIPSGSMADTLVENDRVVVNKLSYRWSSPSRGDVIVFERVPDDPGTIKDLIKRVVALPGERVAIHDDSVWIDGKRLIEPYTDGAPTLPNVQCSTGSTPGLDTPAGYEVPPDHVFVLGDNRTASHDGRCFGAVPEDLIVGRALAVIWPPSKIGRL